VTRTLTTLGLAAYDVVLDAVHVGADRVLGGIECDGDAVAAWLLREANRDGQIGYRPKISRNSRAGDRQG
jgi:hypothetical protein